MAKGKKTGGRSKGTPNRATQQIRDFAQALLNRPRFIQHLQWQLDRGVCSDRIVQLLFYYAAGKPTQTVNVKGSLTLEQLVAGVKEGDLENEAETTKGGFIDPCEIDYEDADPDDDDDPDPKSHRKDHVLPFTPRRRAPKTAPRRSPRPRKPGRPRGRK